MAVAAIFPGQGNQFKGMGRDLWDNSEIARGFYISAGELSGVDVAGISFEGSEEEQGDVVNSQLITYVHGCILHTLLGKKFDFYAGHSLGLYNALEAKEVFSFGEGVLILKRRGELVKKFVEEDREGGFGPGKSCLVVSVGSSGEEVESFCEGNGLEVALYNCPGNYVLGGPPKLIDLHFNNIPGRKKRWNVCCPVHTSYLREVSEEFRDFLRGFDFEFPGGKVYSNVTGDVYRSADEIRESLALQICEPVRWWETLEKVGDVGYFEIGSGKSLAKMVRRIHGKKASVVNVSGWEDFN